MATLPAGTRTRGWARRGRRRRSGRSPMKGKPGRKPSMYTRYSVPLFDAGRASPSLLAAGDKVRFTPVSADECRALEAGLRNGEIDPMQWLVADAARSVVTEDAA